MNTKEVIRYITGWLCDYITANHLEGFVVGISGGVDSALTSVLCARTGLPVLAISMPIRQSASEHLRAKEHLEWLKKTFTNVETREVDLTGAFEKMESTLEKGVQDWLTMANTRARLRMTTLYAYASHHKRCVTGTGNKVEDFGVGFFTKYGDGGVDISPIADLMKSDVYVLAKELGIIQPILDAKPTDGLWEDGRSDEEQIGASYDELEWAMNFLKEPSEFSRLSERQRKVLDIYERLHKANLHKMKSIPLCRIPPALK